MFDKVITKNVSSLFGIQMANYIIPLITLPYLVRVLGVEGYGYLGFALAITQYFILVVNYGFDLSATSNIAKVSQNKKAVSQIFWNVTAIRLIACIIGGVLLLIGGYLLDSLKDIISILFACYISVLGTALFPQWLFQGKEQLGNISTIRVALQISTIPLLFLFVTDKSHVWQAALIGSMPMIGIAVAGTLLIVKRGWISWSPISFGLIKKQLIEGWHIFISTAAINLYTTSVTVVLGGLSGPASVGYFTAANRLIKAVLGLYGPISNAFYPRINAVVNTNKTAAIILIKKLYKLQLGIAIISTLGIFLLAEKVTLLFYGTDFGNTVIVLKILSLLPIVICTSNVLGIQTLIPFGYKKEFSRVLLVSGGFSLFLLFPLTYRFAEFGAAVSVLLTEIIVTSLMCYVIKNKKVLQK